MSYSPGSGSGSIATSSDVALSNPSTSQVLTYLSSVGKWENQNIFMTETAVQTANYTAAAGQRVICDPVSGGLGGFKVKLPAVPSAGTIRVEVALATSDGSSTVQVVLQNGTALTTTGLVLAAEIKAYEASAGGAWRVVGGLSISSFQTWLQNQGTFAAAPATGDSYASYNAVTATFNYTKGYYIEPAGGWSGTTRPSAPQYFELVCTSFSDQPSWVISGDTITSQSGS